MTLAWDKEQHRLAKEGGKALIKLQCQLKHCGGGDYKATGPVSRDHGLALWILACLQDGDPRIAQVLEILSKKAAPAKDVQILPRKADAKD